jgi:uncharacterized membrane protein YhaH (DUF805 family)
MNIIHNLKETYLKTFRYNGRSSRTEFWVFQLYIIVAYVVILSTMVLLPEIIDNVLTFFLIFAFAHMPTLLALSVRRWHDIGFSGGMVLINAIPYVGWIISLVCHLIKSDDAANEYGEPPLGVK